MVFVPPYWFEGMLIQIMYYLVIPLVVGTVIGLVAWIASKEFGIGFLAFIASFFRCFCNNGSCDVYNLA